VTAISWWKYLAQLEHFWKYIFIFERDNRGITQIKAGDNSTAQPQITAEVSADQFRSTFLPRCYHFWSDSFRLYKCCLHFWHYDALKILYVALIRWKPEYTSVTRNKLILEDSNKLQNRLPRVWITIGAVWIVNWIYGTPIARNYK
jgi:hypothetical protein